MAIQFKSFAVQNWLITPGALAVNEAPPAPIDQTWQIVLTGVGIIDLPGNNAHDWRRETLWIQPAILPAIGFVFNRFGIPFPNDPDAGTSFDVDQIVPFAAVSSSFSRQTGTVDAGFAVDQWRHHDFAKAVDITGRQVNQFTGIDVDIAVRNNIAVMHRVSYHIILTGRVVFVPLPR